MLPAAAPNNLLASGMDPCTQIKKIRQGNARQRTLKPAGYFLKRECRLAALPFLTAEAMLFLVGCGFGSATLGLAALQQYLPATAAPLATSLVATAACLFVGMVQPLVGAALGAPQS